MPVSLRPRSALRSSMRLVRQPRAHVLALAAATLFGPMAIGTAVAASCTWNPVSGNWGTAANWSCGVVPGNVDSATIATGRTTTINSAQQVQNLTNAGSVNIDAFLLTLAGGGGTTNTGTINVGAGPIPNNAALNVSAGHNIINTGGVINISADSVLNQFGSTITGGTINTTGTGRVVLFNNSANYFNNVTLNGKADLATATGVLRVINGFTLNGSASIDNGSLINLEGTQTIGGTGSFVFGSTGNNRLGVDGGGIITTLGANTTVRGHTGSIGLGQLVNGSGNTIRNQGLISSDSGGTISIVQSSLTNQGIAEATGAGSVLSLQSNVNNVGGTLRGTGGGVVLQNGVAVSGGTITTTTGGSYRFTNSGNNFLSGATVTAGSLVDMASALSIGRITGGLTLNGVVNVNSASRINFEGDQTLSGNGSIVFGSAAGNILGIDGGNKTLTIASTATVRGENGLIGIGQFVNGSGNALLNNGTVSADVAGGVITLAFLTGGITNNGVIQASNGGIIQLQSNLTGGASGQLVAGAGSRIEQQGVTISGIVNTSGGGSLRPNNSGNNYLSGVTLNGNLDMASAISTERVIGNLVLNGVVNVNSASRINFEGDQTLSGNGSIVFGSGAGNIVGVDGGNKTLTIASTATIRGENGLIGIGQLINGNGNALINNGTISADVAGGTITLFGLTSGITNNGTIQATNGGTIRLQSNLIGTASGQLLAGAGSLISQEGVTISGIVNNSGGGSLRPNNSGNNYLSGVTLNGNLDMASAISTERVIGNLVLNGVVNVNSASRINFEGDQTLSGNGSIVFGSGAGNIVGVDGGNKTLTIASTATIRGENGLIGIGQLVNGNGNSLINQGLISSDSGGTINIAGLTNSLVNQAIIEATGAGSVLRFDNNIDNSAGTIRSTNGGKVVQAGVTVSGGTITNSSGGSYQIIGSGANFLSGVTVTGGSAVDMASTATTARVINGMTLNGTVNVDSTSLLNFEGTQTLAGSGSIVFGSAASNRIGVDGGNITLTIASGVTMSGTNGTIGMGQLINGSGNSVVNNGSIISSGGGTITVAGLTSGLTNDGLVRAQNGALNVQVGLTGTGTLQVDATGSMTLANGAKTQGTLAMGAVGAALNLGTGNLTLSSDYTNGAWGSGNSFNRRAGVTGTGQIVAAANAAQVISGTTVTGGNTTNATLTIGNVRVGANNFDYTVGNSGSTGPTLRGAVQTNVNGANLSDARLSGSGVAATNYNAGAPAGSGESRTVTFSVASAGAIAPMSGQVLNLRSNFENIADQKLNIVLGAGAAAYNAAVGSSVTPVQVANQRVGGSNSATLNISNTAPAGAFSEDLNAGIASFSGQATASGSVSGRLAGTNNTGTGAITVGVNSATAGARTGTVNLSYQTAGTVNGVSNGLGTAAAGGQAVTVNGNVYQLAAGAIQTGALNFGTVQVGQNVQQALVVRNTASGAAGFVEDLNASFGAASGTGAGLISGAGSLNGILAGTNSTAGNGSMVVSVNTGAAGAINGSILVNYNSAGAVGGVSNGLGTFGVGSEGYGVIGTIQATGNVINQASPLINNPLINLGSVRVGALAPTGTVSVTNVATAPPQAALNASISPTSGPISASGSFNLLNPGATNTTSLNVSLNTAVAGNYTGANAGKATIAFVSDANNVGNCAPNCQLNLASQTVDVAGKVYQQAVGATPTTALNFGVVRVGDTVTAKNIVINNTAAVAGLNDTLRADLGGVGGAFTGSGSVSGVAAQGSGNIAVGLNTSTAGVYTASGSVAFTSQNADMADVSAGANANVLVDATVNNLANGDFDFVSGNGTLSQTGTNYLLDLGTVTVGTLLSSLLQFDNDVAGPADVLSGGFNLAGVDDFSLASAWGSAIGNLAAGGVVGGLGVNWLAGAVGLFTDTIVFNGLGKNLSDSVGLAQTRLLTIRANVVGVPPSGVPEPGTLALLMAAAAAAFASSVQRRRVAARRAVH